MKSSRLIFTYIVIFSALLFVQASVAQQGRSPEAAFHKGNAYYEEGQYDKAIQAYSQLLEQGLESGNLYFNIGNSYFKKGELGKAILNYERAKRLIPRDGDLKTNYKFAVSKIAYNISDGSSWMQRAVDRSDILTVNEMVVILSCIFTAIVLFLIVSVPVKKIRRYAYIIVAVSVIIFATFALSLYGKVSALDNEAILISENAEAKYEPMDNATTHFTLYEGMKVCVLELKREWAKVRRPDGKTGWIRGRAIEKI